MLDNLRRDAARLRGRSRRGAPWYWLEALLTDNGFQAVVLYRLASWYKRHGLPLLGPATGRFNAVSRPQTSTVFLFLIIAVRAASFLLHRLTEAVAFTIHLEDVTIVGKSIQQRGGHPFSLKDLDPLTEWQVACDQEAATFISIGEDLKEQLRAGAGEREIA